MKFADLKDLAEKNGLSATNHGQGHWAVTGGECVVNFWPFSKRRTIFVKETNQRIAGGTIQQVVDLAGKEKKPEARCGLLCPECGARMRLRSSRFGPFYSCEKFPECKGSHGAHPDGTPLGTPANKETKEWRMKAHDAFDSIWKTAGVKNARKKAYAFLAEQMDMLISDCHIGSFTQDECRTVIELCQDKSFWHRMLKEEHT
jgi:ssDNA-binding Zn-finger/Zn-ribbon topoisomerase 1